MLAMVLHSPRQALHAEELPIPEPGPGELQIKVSACAVCRTDLHVFDGDLPKPKRPLILGHEIVGVVSAIGANCDRFRVGDRVGVPWLGGTCSACDK